MVMGRRNVGLVMKMWGDLGGYGERDGKGFMWKGDRDLFRMVGWMVGGSD